MNKPSSHAIYCHELRELMLESGRTFRVPEQLAKSVDGSNDTRFIKAWAAMNGLVPHDGTISFLERA